MKKITAYKCSFCGKILQTRSGMYRHEKKCFYNKQTRSCITCAFLKNRDFIKDRMLTKKEEDILNFKIKGTFYMESVNDPGDYREYPELLDKYKYLYDAEIVNYCKAQGKKLVRLKTQCEYWSNIDLKG